MAVHPYLATIWRLRWPLLATHAVVAVSTVAIIAPLIGMALHVAVRLSGAPALADQDIAMFLLSPTGALLLVVCGSLLLTAAVIEISVMMQVIATADTGGAQWGLRAFQTIAMRLPRLLRFAVHLILRILALVLPVAGAVAALAWWRLSDYDINYYLSLRPPEFTTTLYLAAPIVLAGAAALVAVLVRWSLALPAVLFQDIAPRAAFGVSAELTRGRRLRLLGLFALWTGVVLLVGASVSLVATGLAHLVEPFGQGGIGKLVAALGVVLVLWALMLMAATTLTRAGFAALLLAEYRAAGGTVAEGSYRAAPVPVRRMRQAAVLGVALLAAAGLLGVQLNRSLAFGDDVQVVAHRGAAGIRPENTLPSIEQAILDGADWVEIDVQENADGEVIVVHDSDFMKTAGDPLKVWDSTNADLDRLDMGGWFDPTYAGTRVPTLREVLETARDRAQVLIELKYYGHDVRLEERVAEIVEEAGMSDQIALMSLKLDGVLKMKALRPDWQVGLLAATAIGDLTQLDVDFLAVNTGMARPSVLRAARNAGRPVLVWTVNDPMTLSQMMSRGVTGVITDYPDRAADVIAARSGMTTAERLLVELADLLGLEIDLPTRTAEGA
jgi:glycerophosphoryl diester phosphodiesterase